MTEPRLRADALANRARILSAARDAFVELGPGAPLEEISRRAGTGIATLYRRFPDRHALLRAVALDTLAQVIESGRRARKEEQQPLSALIRYMHGVLDARTAAVMPAILEELPRHDEELERLRGEGSQLLDELVRAAHQAGTLREEVTSGDIGILCVRLARPLVGPFTREVNDQLAHRHLDLLINGLRAGTGEVGGPAITVGELRHLATD